MILSFLTEAILQLDILATIGFKSLFYHFLLLRPASSGVNDDPL